MNDKKRKYGDRAVIEPARVIQERKKIGLHPSCPVLAELSCVTTLHSGNRFVQAPEMLNVMAG
jgi:hypothetical protein